MEPLDKKTKRWLTLMKLGAKMGCHQISNRSFSYKGYQFPVCARCTGVIIGEFLTIIALFCSLKIDLFYAFILIIPLVIDGSIQYIHILESNNVRRVITGLLAGIGLTYIYFYILVYLTKTLLDIIQK